MKRRVYKLTTKRQKIVKEAMGAMREARAEIAPELLDNVRDAIATALEREQAQKEVTSETKMRLEHVPVDKKKNLMTVMKFLEMQPDNKALHRELTSFLSQ